MGEDRPHVCGIVEYLSFDGRNAQPEDLLCSEAPRWAWARVRDQEQKKVSFFDPVGARKARFWANRSPFDRALSGQRHFASHGVSTIPFEMRDESKLLAVQPLVGAMFRYADSIRLSRRGSKAWRDEGDSRISSAQATG